VSAVTDKTPGCKRLSLSISAKPSGRREPEAIIKIPNKPSSYPRKNSKVNRGGGTGEISTNKRIRVTRSYSSQTTTRVDIQSMHSPFDGLSTRTSLENLFGTTPESGGQSVKLSDPRGTWKIRAKKLMY